MDKFKLTNTPDYVSTPADNNEITDTPKMIDLSTNDVIDNINDSIGNDQPDRTTPQRKRPRKAKEDKPQVELRAGTRIITPGYPDEKFFLELREVHGSLKVDLVRPPGMSSQSLTILNRSRSYYLGIAHHRDVMFRVASKTKRSRKNRSDLLTFLLTPSFNGYPISFGLIKRATGLSKTWAQSFAERNALNTEFHKVPNPSIQELNTAKCEIQNTLMSMQLNSIFVVEKAPLFYELYPKDLRLITSKKVNDQENWTDKNDNEPFGRIMMLMATNAVGFKIPIAIIGNERHIPYFDHSAKGLPYIYQKHGWVDENVIKTWFDTVFAPAVSKYTPEKVVLLVDTTWFPLDLADENGQVDLIGLPASDTSKLQPLKQGISFAMQMKFRLHILDVWVRTLTIGGDIYNRRYANCHAEQRIAEGLAPDLKATITFLNRAWNSIPEHFISTCWVVANVLPYNHDMALKQCYVRYMTCEPGALFVMVASCDETENHLFYNLESFEAVKIRMEENSRKSVTRQLFNNHIVGLEKYGLKKWLTFENTPACKKLMSLELEAIVSTEFRNLTPASSAGPSTQQDETNNVTLPNSTQQQ